MSTSDLMLQLPMLGRKAIKTDTRTLLVRDYLTPALPPAPKERNWTCGIKDWGMMLNATLGCCTIAARNHAIQVWSANLGKEITLPDSDVLAAYEKWCGYDPRYPCTDEGGVELDVLNDWRQQGGALDGHPLLAFADAAPLNISEVRQAINLFGGVYIGVNLPLTAQTQDVWDFVPGTINNRSGSWGGHAVYVPKYDETGFTCITWGGLKRMTIDFWNSYVDEVHALLSPDWITAQVAPNDFNLAQLEQDLAEIR